MGIKAFFHLNLATGSSFCTCYAVPPPMIGLFRRPSKDPSRIPCKVFRSSTQQLIGREESASQTRVLTGPGLSFNKWVVSQDHREEAVKVVITGRGASHSKGRLVVIDEESGTSNFKWVSGSMTRTILAPSFPDDLPLSCGVQQE